MDLEDNHLKECNCNNTDNMCIQCVNDLEVESKEIDDFYISNEMLPEDQTAMRVMDTLVSWQRKTIWIQICHCHSSWQKTCSC